MSKPIQSAQHRAAEPASRSLRTVRINNLLSCQGSITKAMIGAPGSHPLMTTGQSSEVAHPLQVVRTLLYP